MFCQKCGAPLQPNERFCQKCGAPNNQQPQQGFQAGYQPGYPYAQKSSFNFGLPVIFRLSAAFLFLLEYVFWFVKTTKAPSDLLDLIKKANGDASGLNESMASNVAGFYSVITAILFAVAAAALVLKAFNVKIPVVDISKIPFGIAFWMLFEFVLVTIGGFGEREIGDKTYKYHMPVMMWFFIIILVMIFGLLVAANIMEKAKEQNKR